MLLGTYPNDLKSYVHRKTCTQMFIAALYLYSALDTEYAGALILDVPVSRTDKFLLFINRLVCGILYGSLNGLRLLIRIAKIQNTK